MKTAVRELDKRNSPRIATVSRLFLNVGDLHHPLGSDSAVEPSSRSRAQYRFAPSLLRKTGRCIMLRSDSKGISFADIQRAELGLADTHGVAEHGRKHRLQFAGRARDNLQHLGRCGLLLSRLR
jgi:hypothetical protein